MKRMWINQPSKLNPLHRFHGTLVLATADGPDSARVYFLSGDTVSMSISTSRLSEGWPKHLQQEAKDGALYKTGVEWIALNDNAGNGDDHQGVCGYITTCLLADLFKKPVAKVASDIMRIREEQL